MTAKSRRAVPKAMSPALPFFAWVIPPELQWWDIAGREPHPSVARELLAALAHA
jgi:hypothetical protein